MIILHKSKQLCSRAQNIWSKCLYSQSYAAALKEISENTNNINNAEYTDEPNYPEIQDLSFRARKQRQREDWREQVRAVRTVEEKMIKINMPRYYGYKVVKLGDTMLPYNILPATQHYTRSVFEESALRLESIDETKSKQLDAFVQAVRGDVQEGLEYAHDYFKHKYENASNLDAQEYEKAFTQLIVEQINRSLINTLAADYPHFQDTEIDYNPRHEAFWFVGGIDPPKNVVQSKKGREWQKEMAHDPVDRLMQYDGEPYLTLRHRLQLPSFDIAAEIAKIQTYKYDPRTLGYATDYQHGTNIPGFWPGSPRDFGFISYQSRAHMNIRSSSYGSEDFKEVLHAQAILSSFAWLLAQANYNGFNTFSELTYPLNTQTIITNGRDWSFYEYQLNTVLMYEHHVHENPKFNYCRGTNEMRLFEEFDDTGKCIAFNDQVLRYLVQFYANTPIVERSQAELQPFLNAETKRIADYTDDEQRVFLERVFKNMVSNRPRHLAIPEIYLWEKIYKIDNKTRQMEARRRYFELDLNPWKRTMDQHQNEYIPRALREDSPKGRRNKWKKLYYP